MDNPETLATLGSTRHRTPKNKTKIKKTLCGEHRHWRRVSPEKFVENL
jgi:hypothetical protein